MAAMAMQAVSLDVSPRGVATILLNRPERGNAVDQGMLDEIARLLQRCAADERTRIILLRGAGKHFCAGADLSKRGAEPIVAADTGQRRVSLVDVLTLLDGVARPAVAVVQGAAVGGGAAFAACCDVVLASEAAFFSIPEVRVGMAPHGVAPFLIRAMGHRGFRRYGLSGERISAAQALRIGLAHEVCAAETLEAKLGEIVNALLHGAPGAQRDLKAGIERYASPSLAAIAPALTAHDPAQSEEAREGIASFKEKRKPRWYTP